MPSKPAQEESGALDKLHLALDVVGLVPGLGEAADLANAAIYAAEGKKLDAALSLAAAVPFAGGAATAAKLARRARLNKKFGRTGSLHEDINIRGRQETARNFFKSEGVPDHKIDGYMRGVDFTKPVEVQTINRGKPLLQHQIKDAPQGNWFTTNKASSPDELGINPEGLNHATGKVEPKVVTTHAPQKPVKVLKSTAAPTNDTWSVPGTSYPAPGGGTQIFTTNKTDIKPK